MLHSNWFSEKEKKGENWQPLSILWVEKIEIAQQKSLVSINQTLIAGSPQKLLPLDQIAFSFLQETHTLLFYQIES